MSTLTIQSEQPEILKKLRAFLETVPGIRIDFEEIDENWIESKPYTQKMIEASITELENGQGVTFSVEEIQKMVQTNEKH